MAAAFDAVAEEYDAAYSTRADQAENTVIFGAAIALYHSGPPGLFIDLGCGPGTAVPYLNGHVKAENYLGIDPAPQMVRTARRRYPGWRFSLGDEQNCVRTRMAQMILGAFGPMQYVDDLDFFANSIRMSLAPGGRFLLMGRTRQVPTRVLGSDALTRPYSAAAVRSAFAGRASFDIYGLRRSGRESVRRLSVRMQVRLLRRDRELLRDPALYDWLVIEGRKL